MDTSAPSYTVTGTLHEGQRVSLLRAVRSADGLPVVLKVLDPRRSRPKDIEHLKHEYAIGKALDHEAVVTPLALETYEGLPALVLEDFGGEPLDRFIGAPMKDERFLDLAVRIAACVAAIHEQEVIHKNLKPQNILVNTATGQVKLADFGLASGLSREQPPTGPPRLIEGSLPYLSPEQTGRMNRAIDSRADLYALGVTFYEMLTGRLPFEARDPLEWVHCHVARAPPPPSALVPELPEVLSALVLKLLAKMAEDRYQTARGLKHDLERCAAQRRAIGRSEPFPLAERDVSGRFQIPQKLYGREDDAAILLRAFDRLVATGSPELVLVSGYSGIGKSTLVHELYRPIVRERALFLSGKFDQYKRDIPYATLVQAFRELVLEILAEAEDRIAAWRQWLLGALGSNGQLIVDVIPQIELIIGRQPPVPELPPAEAQHRFRVVFRHFIGVFARQEHPLALFLDDLQWTDSASLELLRDLVTHPETRHLLVIGAFRDNEVTSSHPLMLALDHVRNEGTRISAIVLGPLSREDLAALVSDALHCRREDAAPLSRLIHEKTGGNPFFAIQFLTELHEERLIEFDEGAEAFRWDVARIRGKGFTDNVIDLMVGKLVRLSPRTQRALKQLACLGNTAEVALLTIVHGGSEEDVHADLRDAAREGLAFRLDGTYKFLHDRVQEAAYSLIPEGERAAAHLGIGRLLASRTPPEELEEKIFEIVNQLNRGAALLTSREERERAAELNLIAGKRAKGSTAYASALKYLAAGAAFLEEDSWDRRYDLAFALALHRAACEFLTGELGAAEERLSELARRARSTVDVAAVTFARVDLYTTLDRSELAVEICLEYLRRIGVDWSPHPTDEEVRQEYERMWQKLGSRPLEEILDLPPMTDPDCRATIDVLTSCDAAALFTDENLLCLMNARVVNLSLERGNSDGSCLAYVRVGTSLGPRFGDYRAGFHFGKLGFDLAEKGGLLRFKARVDLVFWYVINPWTRHMRTGVGPLRRSFYAAAETGDLTYSSCIRTALVALLLAEGDPLGEVQREAERGLEFTRKARFGLSMDTITTLLQLTRMLRGQTLAFGSFDDDHFDERRFERRLEDDPRLAYARCLYWIRKVQAHFHAGDHASAIESAARAQRVLWMMPSFLDVAEYHFYGALARAGRHDAAPADERPSHLVELVVHHRQLEVWASSCPENFGACAALVSAEIARIGEEWDKAAQLYEQAIRSARESGFVHNEALGYEIASRFYRMRGFDLIADTYLREARACYARWGADGKVKQIDQQNPRLWDARLLAQAASFAARSEELDLLSVLKASQTISSEIVLEKLLRTLLTFVLEQGGAQRACLILCQDGRLSIEAEATLDENESGGTTIHLAPLPGESSWQRVPLSLVHYVQRTKESVILHDAVADAGKFSGDDYVARRRSKSLLCVPILRRSEVAGLLYLENNLLAGAFTPDRLTALSLLATQAAVSLENARLLAKEQSARTVAESAERRAAFLAEAGEILSASLDCGETLSRVARLSVQTLCDWCAIDALEGGAVRRLSWAHRDPSKEPLIEELERRYPSRWESRRPASRVLRLGEPLLLPELSEEVLRQYCEDGGHERLMRELGTHSVIVVPLLARGQPIGALTVVSSAPEIRYGDADLALVQEVARRAAIAIDNARLYGAAQEAVRVRDEFLTVATHELNTPMTSLTLTLEAMDRALRSCRPLDPQAMGRQVDRALRQAARLARLNSELLDVSRINAARLRLDVVEVDLGEVVRDALARFKLDLARAGCAVSLRERGRVVGLWDGSRVDQIVSNLLANAIKFGAGKPVEIAIGEEAGAARLSVRDHGIGIDPARQAQIFERFERAVSDRHYGGLGLGLYISRRIAEAHGGSIRVESALGAGATFIVELPRNGPPRGAESSCPPG
ncbi:sensor histidine kinase [Sorangium atrum]|uniref:histidine kinase n=1 Tax=Sorangium atrum TaxID=2995308 RepID=A0ABT5BRV4_9BACT|nr:ATP-binding sensor histidine kinase [Sorangium aterium]MDC0676285.1 trifunctional serine/threonine-protein kinase/ATP-binding protein/sensor histidine kinase [Sorangium aterium]